MQFFFSEKAKIDGQNFIIDFFFIRTKVKCNKVIMDICKRIPLLFDKDIKK